jgi:hypothetical protein
MLIMDSIYCLIYMQLIGTKTERSGIANTTYKYRNTSNKYFNILFAKNYPTNINQNMYVAI